ncbi:hypothetical protein C8J56DRAFT_934549 [Mycena floridula]|nr:hypothetical protein C8J56DRAFT_934549 [Mycena floridula]
MMDDSETKYPLRRRPMLQLLTAWADERHIFSALASRKNAWYRPLLAVIVVFPLSTVLVVLSLRTLPISLASWPRTITDIAQLSRELHGYAQSDIWSTLHVLSVLSISAIWKHAWSIPGSVIWNVIGGALLPPLPATFLLTLLTTLGSICATLLAAPLAPVFTWSLPKVLDVTRAALLQGESSFSSIPLPIATTSQKSTAPSTPAPAESFPDMDSPCSASPYWDSDCFLGTFVGCLPWTVVTCQIVFLTLVSVAPILAREWLKGLLGMPDIDNSSESTPPASENSRARSRRDWGSWIRRSISLPRSRQSIDKELRERRDLEIAQLVREKVALEVEEER